YRHWRGDYSRCQICSRQMNTRQPDTPSWSSPCICILARELRPLDGSRMVPPAQSSSFGGKPHRIVMPWMGWSLRSPEHLSQTGFGPRSDWRISTTVPCSVPSGARLISTMDLALPVSSSMVFQRPSGPDWAYKLDPANKNMKLNRVRKSMSCPLGRSRVSCHLRRRSACRKPTSGAEKSDILARNFYVVQIGRAHV